jgi:3-hydroxyisobutyrate dehydrogenase-like beta-hydroxyacid dehydrogenase
VLNVRSGRSSATQDKFPRAVLTRTFDYGFAVERMLKDVSLFGEMAASLEVPAFISREVIEQWRLASRGLGPKDFTNIVRVMEEWARVEIGPSIR